MLEITKISSNKNKMLKKRYKRYRPEHEILNLKTTIQFKKFNAILKFDAKFNAKNAIQLKKTKIDYFFSTSNLERYLKFLVVLVIFNILTVKTLIDFCEFFSTDGIVLIRRIKLKLLNFVPRRF